MLDVKGIDVHIADKKILQETSLTVHDGEIVGVLGPSGSGKSTLLRAISGLVNISSGDITWDQTSLSGVPTHHRGFGLMFQGYALFPHMDVAENVGFGLQMKSHPDIENEVGAALEWVGLAGFGRRSIDSLSGGGTAAGCSRSNTYSTAAFCDARRTARCPRSQPSSASG